MGKGKILTTLFPYENFYFCFSNLLPHLVKSQPRKNNQTLTWAWLRREGAVRGRERGGRQNMPPAMLLWHISYFELQAIKKQQMQEELSAHPLPA